jgi:hypothetical protein
LNKKAIALSGFISFSALELMSILSATAMGRMSNLSIDKQLRLAISFTIIVGLFGIILSFLFAKIEKYLPFKSLIIKAIMYFLALNFLFSIIKGPHAVLNIDFILSSVGSLLAALVFVKALNYFNR